MRSLRMVLEVEVGRRIRRAAPDCFRCAFPRNAEMFNAFCLSGVSVDDLTFLHHYKTPLLPKMYEMYDGHNSPGG